MGEVAPVEDVVLQHEEDVEKDGEEAEAELGGVAEDAAPVVVVVGNQHHLRADMRETGTFPPGLTRIYTSRQFWYSSQHFVKIWYFMKKL